MNVGVIGLGAMGAPMAANLHRAGLLHGAWNRTRARADAFAAQTGARLAADPADLAQGCDAVILSVARDADVLEVIDRIAASMAQDSVVIDTSTVSTDTARVAAQRLAAHGVHLLDAPVSGGVEGARQGTLAMMVGGDPEVLDRVRPMLAAITTKVLWMGPTGSGQATKAVNQIVAAGIAQAVTEGLAFGRYMDLDLDKVIDVVARGAAGNWFLDHRGPTLVRGSYAPGFKIRLHAKDLRICQDMLRAGHEQFRLPVVETALQDYAQLIDRGHGDEDISALYRLQLERLGLLDG